ncbi:zinc finger protein 43 isoform X1 [Corythoichthys intestinalis]|uniref:zinc finger protein 43 isoform X1 n=1 Tax=Corythoichthys intestinalis TaxID=161448 RepID=UPI0025A55567|nr:zinc finger protein 43 isoform X1 [Corythoichthys intestinalis]XP_061789215.1 zinc finger protein 43-like [Nerophis lumbriciformis]
MDQVPAVEMEDVRAEEQSTATDVTLANSDEPPAEDNEDSKCPTSSQDTELFSCQYCGEAFAEEEAYLSHRHQHPDGKCTMYLEPMDDSDEAVKDEESANSCQLCTVSFDDMNEFRSHMETHCALSSDTNQISGSIKQNSYECPDCGKKYSMLGHYLNHQRTHIQAPKSLFNELEEIQKKSFKCEICGRNYSRASALDAHRRGHEEKLFKCQFRTSKPRTVTVTDKPETKVVQKPTSPTLEKHFRCVCGKTFTALMGLKTHQRFSQNFKCFTQERNGQLRKNVFYCLECRKVFHGHIAWYNHEKWHETHKQDSTERFSCETCGKVFMTQTFYYRHQRMAHSGSAPTKSFVHQVDQLKKKAFECSDCGLKFSRLSALHSHELQHTSAFGETDKFAMQQSPLLNEKETLERKQEVTHQSSHHVLAENVPHDITSERDPNENEPEEGAMESYEPGDFNVLVISASESEDEAIQDINPNLDSGCGSDHEGRDNVPDSNVVSKPELDLKIVQVEFEPTREQRPPAQAAAECNEAKEKFYCAECYRWFTSEASLRSHVVWHKYRKRRLQMKGQSVDVYTCNNEARTFAAGHVIEYENDTNQELNQAELLEQKSLTCDICGTNICHLSHQGDKQLLCQNCETSGLINLTSVCSDQPTESILTTTKLYNPKKTLLGPKIYHCEQCGKGFWSLGAFSHHKQSPSQCVDVRLRTGVAQPLHRGRSRSSINVACPVCGRKFRHKGIMTLHMRTHENGNHECEFCNRSFRLFSSLIRHQVVHSELLPPPSKSFQHQVEQLKKNAYSCPDCGKLFSRAKALKFHMKYHGKESGHSPSPPRSNVSQEDLQCVACLKHFSNKASLRTHTKLCIKTEHSRLVCKTENLNNNESVKLSKVNLQDGTVKLSPNLGHEINYAHLENSNVACGIENTSDLKYKCNKCEKRFSIVGALNLHKRVHAKGYKKVAKATLSAAPSEEELRKDYPFPCSECGKRFLSNSALGSHKRWHRNDRLSSFKEELSDSHLADHPMSALQHEPEVGPQSESLNFSTEGSSLAEHSDTSEAGDAQKLIAKNYHCPLCSERFSKAMDLRAHTWQAHSNSTEDIQQSDLGAQNTRVVRVCEIKPENVSTQISKVYASPLNVPNHDCGNKREGTATLPDRKLCSGSKVMVQSLETLAEVSPNFSCLPEPMVKCLFKCGKCGKAFQTEGQLETHKSKAKSRPFGCALCCNGFLTENQLNQHLAWHDQIRFRLPNEVRFRLSAALSAKSVKPAGKTFSPDGPNQPALKQESQSVSKSMPVKKPFQTSSVLETHNCLHCKNAVCACTDPSVTTNDLTALSKHGQASVDDSRWQTDGPAAVLSGHTDALTCLECGATFNQETDLHQHYTKHAQGMY